MNKWRALEDLATRLACPTDAIVAVGDEVNDIEMITHAGLGVAMADANAAVLDIADHVCGAHDQDGLIPLFDHLLSANAPDRTEPRRTDVPEPSS